MKARRVRKTINKDKVKLFKNRLANQEDGATIQENGATIKIVSNSKTKILWIKNLNSFLLLYGIDKSKFKGLNIKGLIMTDDKNSLSNSPASAFRNNKAITLKNIKAEEKKINDAFTKANKETEERINHAYAEAMKNIELPKIKI